MIVLEEKRALRRALEFRIARLVAGRAAAVSGWRKLHLDDLGAELGHDPRAGGAGDELRDVEHAVTGEHGHMGLHGGSNDKLVSPFRRFYPFAARARSNVGTKGTGAKII